MNAMQNELDYYTRMDSNGIIAQNKLELMNNMQ